MIFESVPIWVSTVNVTVTFEHGFAVLMILFWKSWAIHNFIMKGLYNDQYDSINFLLDPD